MTGWYMTVEEETTLKHFSSIFVCLSGLGLGLGLTLTQIYLVLCQRFMSTHTQSQVTLLLDSVALLLARFQQPDEGKSLERMVFIPPVKLQRLVESMPISIEAVLETRSDLTPYFFL